MFNFKEFLTVPKEDLQDWWIQHKLPDPGCPINRTVVWSLCYVLHNGPEAERAAAIKATLKDVKFHYTNKDLAFFYFSYKDKSLAVPLDSSCLDVNFTFIAALYGRYQ